jgi:SNF2 family DNA or RNA helicase
VILLDPALELADEGQAIARVLRLGQTRPVKVFRVFMRDSAEERLLLMRKAVGQLGCATETTESTNGNGNGSNGSSSSNGRNGNSSSSSSNGGGGDVLAMGE